MTKCIKCGKIHGMVIENTTTGESTPIQHCEECLFAGCGFKNDPEYEAGLQDSLEKCRQILEQCKRD